MLVCLNKSIYLREKRILDVKILNKINNINEIEELAKTLQALTNKNGIMKNFNAFTKSICYVFSCDSIEDVSHVNESLP